MNLQLKKGRLRKSMMQYRNEYPEAELKNHSIVICQKIWELVVTRNVETIHSFIPMGKEINVKPLLQKALDQGLKVVSSKTLKQRQLKHLELISLDKLEPGTFGTQYPAGGIEYTGTYDLIIVPGLVFDRNGNRIGYGAGYYDTFLNNHPLSYKVGVAYPFQVIDKVNAEDHDIRLDLILYPK